MRLLHTALVAVSIATILTIYNAASIMERFSLTPPAASLRNAKSSTTFSKASPKGLITHLLSSSLSFPPSDLSDLAASLSTYDDELHKSMLKITDLLITIPSTNGHDTIPPSVTLSREPPPTSAKTLVRSYIHHAQQLQGKDFGRLEKWLLNAAFGDAFHFLMLSLATLTIDSFFPSFREDELLRKGYNEDDLLADDDDDSNRPIISTSSSTPPPFKLDRNLCTECSTNMFTPPTGFTPNSFSGFTSKLVCPSMFRDLSDYVLDFPFESYNEHVYLHHTPSSPDDDVDWMDLQRLIKLDCLPPVPIIFWHNDVTDDDERGKLSKLDVPFILITAQSDHDAPKMFNGIASNPNLRLVSN